MKFEMGVCNVTQVVSSLNSELFKEQFHQNSEDNCEFYSVTQDLDVV